MSIATQLSAAWPKIAAATASARRFGFPCTARRSASSTISAATRPIRAGTSIVAECISARPCPERRAAT